jgi:hypothetical protein
MMVYDDEVELQWLNTTSSLAHSAVSRSYPQPTLTITPTIVNLSDKKVGRSENSVILDGNLSAQSRFIQN